MALKIGYKASEKDGRFYVPDSDGGGIINVVDSMPWTLSPQNSRINVPKMILDEYQQSTGQLLASIIYFSRTFQGVTFDTLSNTLIGQQGDPAEVYKNKYFGTPTNFRYIFPYFESANLSRSTTYTGQDNDNPFGSLAAKSFFTGNTLGKFISNVGANASFVGGVVNASMAGKINFEFPKSWESTSAETYSTTFDLFNTNTTDDIIANRKFCHLFSYQNTPSRRNFAIVDPPVIYSMRIPGIVDLPACYVNKLEITNLGNTRQMLLEGIQRTIPEAYRITISFTSLLMPTRNIMLATESGKTVEAITDGKVANQFIDNIKNKLVNEKNNTPLPVIPPTPTISPPPTFVLDPNGGQAQIDAATKYRTETKNLIPSFGVSTPSEIFKQ